MNSKWLSWKATSILSLLAVASFEAAYELESAGWLIVVYLACLFALAWIKTPRTAFYVGFAIGTSIAALQLNFFFGIFGPLATGLWAILGLWIAAYLLFARVLVERWPVWGSAWLPVVWIALEYFRSELYYLRFAWLTPGLAMSAPNAISMAGAGVYGFSFGVLAALTALLLTYFRTRRAGIACTMPVMLLIVLIGAHTTWTPTAAPLVVGIQLEGPGEDLVLSALDEAVRDIPDADLFVLSEYTFNGPIPPAIHGWCSLNKKYLIVGGKIVHDNDADFTNTAFVISPDGECVFEQGKSVPIQFFSDGLPARDQRVWDSPWGKIGIAICYDLSYSRVIDRLVACGAAALVVPTMDAEDWGDHQHRLHARVAPVRAREYGIPIFRLASSGISQLVNREGRVIASAPFPGQSERLVGRLEIGAPGKLPRDRYLALPAVFAAGGLLAYLAVCNLRDRVRRPGGKGLM